MLVDLAMMKFAKFWRQMVELIRYILPALNLPEFTDIKVYKIYLYLDSTKICQQFLNVS